MVRVSKLTEIEIAQMYESGQKVTKIARIAGTSRQAVHNTLNRLAIQHTRREVLTLTCPFCSEQFMRPRSHNKGHNSGYCSVQCFHAARSISGEYSSSGGVISRITPRLVNDRSLGRAAVEALAAAHIFLRTGEVIHHIDGNRENFKIDNLRIFTNHSEHMKYHHSLRKNSLT